jgi:hypothetical protein
MPIGNLGFKHLTAAQITELYVMLEKYKKT